MAEDFGDDAGRQIFDWALRVGMEEYRLGGAQAGRRCLEEEVARLERALENVRDASSGLESPGSPAYGTEGRPLDARFARLDMSELSSLRDGQQILATVDAKLAAGGIWHGMTEEDGKRWLVFRTAEAPAVSSAFDRLASDAGDAAAKAADRLRQAEARDAGDRGAARDGEPLQTRAERARAASEAQSRDGGRDRAPEQNRAEARSK